MARLASAAAMAMMMLVVVALEVTVEAGDTNRQFSPCGDAKIQRWDGFSFGIAFATNESFFSGSTQYSPCDRRLPLSSGGGAQLAVFRPKVDEISLLTINTTTNPKVSSLSLSPSSFSRLFVVDLVRLRYVCVRFSSRTLFF
ncbi:uncharacterized protein M6B38_258240 [Iris pallida]|uniref:Uncharacterized protein n=1 Tax=Iris pallida TaxID=29817 RepID=A0AAX6IES1_IRIPA|nr:uncharacterized protein M6B38_258240 [Iris pallida]